MNSVLDAFGLGPVAWLSDTRLAVLSVVIGEHLARDGVHDAAAVRRAAHGQPRAVDAARVDGAGRMRTLWHITLPQIRPVLMVNVILITIATLNTFDMILALTGGGPAQATEVLALRSYNSVFMGFNLAGGCVFARAAAGASASMLTALYRRLLGRRSGERRAGPRPGAQRRPLDVRRTHPGAAVLRHPAAVDRVAVAAHAEGHPRHDDQPDPARADALQLPRGAGLRAVPALPDELGDPVGDRALRGVAFAAPAAYAFSRMVFRGRRSLMLAVLALQMISPLILAFPLYRYFASLGLLDSIPATSLVYIAILTPLATWMLKGFFDGIPVELDDAALVDGASRWHAFRAVILPVARPGLTAVFVIMALLAWAEFVIPYILLTNPANLPISVGILNFQGNYAVNAPASSRPVACSPCCRPSCCSSHSSASSSARSSPGR